MFKARRIGRPTACGSKYEIEGGWKRFAGRDLSVAVRGPHESVRKQVTSQLNFLLQ
jgi:hypothetical protein